MVTQSFHVKHRYIWCAFLKSSACLATEKQKTKRERYFFSHCDEIAKQLPTNETGAPKNSLKAADVQMMEVKVSGRDSRRPVTLHHKLFWGLNVTRHGFHWHSQMPRGRYANANANTFRYFVAQTDLRLHMVVRQRSEKREMTKRGKPSVGEDGGRMRKEEMWKVSHSPGLRPTLFWGFFLFRSWHNVIRLTLGVCVTNLGMSSLSGVFRPNQRSDCFFKASNSAGVHARCQAGEGRKKKKKKLINGASAR